MLMGKWRVRHGSLAVTCMLISLAYLLLLPTRAQVLGDVFIYTNNYTFDPFPDLPADFGPEVPDEGIDGLLRVADPEDACQPFTYNDTEQTWVALISRSQQLHPTNCTFDVKVRHAEEAGAAAAIVYDDVYEALIIMSKPRDHPDPGIPAVFVSEKAGIIMRKLMTPGQTRVRIVPVSASAWMSLIMSAFLGFLALTVVLATFYVMRSWSVWLGRTRGRRTPADLAGFGGLGPGAQPPTPAGLPACAIRALPILIYEGKASRRHRSMLHSSDTAPGQPAADQHLSITTYASVSEGDWSPAHPAASEQQQLSSSRLQSGASDAHSTTAVASSVVEGVSHQSSALRDAASAAAALAGRLGAVFLHGSGSAELLSSSAPAIVSTAPDDNISRHQQQQLASMRLLGSNSTVSLSSNNSGNVSCLPPASRNSSSTDIAPYSCSSSSIISAAQVNEGVSVDAAGTMPAAGQGCLHSRGPAETPLSSPALSTDGDESDSTTSAVTGVITGGPSGARGGATRRTCVVCLERYIEGDKIRVLPCQHRFHSRCIDPWLANRRLCPVCKHDASQPPPPALQRELAAVAARAAAEAAAAAAAAGAAPAAQTVGSAGSDSNRGSSGLLGFAFLRSLRSRLRPVQQAEQQHASTTVSAPQVVVTGGLSVPGQRQLQPAAAYAAAAAAADAAEAGLLLPGSLRAAVLHNQQHQQQQQQQQQQRSWRSRQRHAQRQHRLVAAFAHQQHQRHHASDLVTPLLPRSGSSTSGTSTTGTGSTGIGRAHSAAAVVQNSTPPLLIPQLTPVQSDASSIGSSFTLGPPSHTSAAS